MLDWFYLSVGVVVAGQVVGCCCCLGWAGLLLAVLAIIRFVIIPVDCDATLWFYEHFGRPIESLRGQVVWITGASTGIGAALALRLARAGVKLAISARSAQKLEEVKQACVDTGGVEGDDVLVVPLDMTHYHQQQAAFDTVLTHFGQLDILVSNAGRTQRANWEDIELDVDKALFDVNVFSLVSLTRIVLRYFLNRGRGHLAVTSSAAGKIGVAISATYTASKHALHGYFECLRQEKSGSGVSVSMVCPGPVDSNLLNICFTDRMNKALGQERTGRMMSSERCSQLFAVTLANQLSEVWISEQPVLSLFYAFQYFPSTVRGIFRLVPANLFKQLRDGCDVMKDQAKERK